MLDFVLEKRPFRLKLPKSVLAASCLLMDGADEALLYALLRCLTAPVAFCG